MRMTFEGSNEEMCKLFDVSSMKHLFTNQDRLEINLGKSNLLCRYYDYQFQGFVAFQLPLE